MTTIELLDSLISDMKDYIEEYRYDMKRGTRIEQYELKIRIDELSKWKETLKVIRSEQE